MTDEQRQGDILPYGQRVYQYSTRRIKGMGDYDLEQTLKTGVFGLGHLGVQTHYSPWKHCRRKSQ